MASKAVCQHCQTPVIVVVAVVVGKRKGRMEQGCVTNEMDMIELPGKSTWALKNGEVERRSARGSKSVK